MSIYMILQTESVISVSKGGNMGNLNETPSANRLHIGIYGKTNSGKSSLINAVTKQEVSIVADVAGTTTDPVYKPMEIHPLGPCVIIDTAGFDDDSELGERRVEKTHLAAEKTDIAVVVLDIAEVIAAKKAGIPFKKAFKDEAEWSLLFAKKHTPVVFALNKIDEILLSAEAQEKSSGKLDNAAIEAAKCWVFEENSAVMGKNADNSFEVVAVSALKGKGMDAVISALTRLLPEDFGQEFILGDLVSQTDLVLLVMPQDIQAPKGRLILPQVQTIRELLDKKCRVVCCTTDQIEGTLSSLAAPPKLIITDSQVFSTVYAQKPAASLLTSFSVLFARYKGDIDYFVESAAAIGQLREDSRVLIAEACTHAPVGEDIGRVKIPAMLRKRIGPALRVDVVAGTDFPADLTPYDLVIHCGACMFNRRHVLSRVAQARAQHVPMTNYGVAIAYLQGILDKIEY